MITLENIFLKIFSQGMRIHVADIIFCFKNKYHLISSQHSSKITLCTTILTSPYTGKCTAIVHSDCDGSVLQPVLDETTDIALTIDNSIRTVNGKSEQQHTQTEYDRHLLNMNGWVLKQFKDSQYLMHRRRMLKLRNARNGMLS